MTKTSKTPEKQVSGKADEVRRAGEAAKPAVEVPQKRPVAILFVMTGSVRMQFTFPMDNPNSMPTPVRTFVEAFRSGNEHLLWSPAANASVQLVPARCVGWEVRTVTLNPDLRKPDAVKNETSKEAEPTDQKPAA